MTSTSNSSRRAKPLRRSLSSSLVAVCVAAGGVLVTFGAPSPSGAAQGRVSRSLVISTMKTAKFGTILVSPRTLYTLSASPAGCNTACQKYWPEVLLAKGVTHAVAGAGVRASKLGTVRRGVRLQVTYAGKPLYWFAPDVKAGQVRGNLTDAWGRWSVVVLAKPATTAKTGATTTVPAGGGGGGIGF